MGPKKATLLIGHPLPLFSEALRVALEEKAILNVAAESPRSGATVIEAVTRLKPDAALIDFWMPDISGSSIASTLKIRSPNCKVILLSWLSGFPTLEEILNSKRKGSDIHQALQAGATAFLRHDCTLKELVLTITKVVAGEEVQIQTMRDQAREFREKASQFEAQLSAFQHLTPRQVQILGLLCAGRSYKQIANELALSPKTVRNQISGALNRTDSRSQSELVAKARACGFISNLLL